MNNKIIELLNKINSMYEESLKHNQYEDDDIDEYSYSEGWDCGRKALADEILKLINEN